MEIANFRGDLKENEALSRHTSFGIGGPADIFACPADRDDLAVLLKEIRRRGLKFFIVGGGTNLLVRDGGFRGVIVNLRNMGMLRIEREYRSVGGSFATIYAEAGAPLGKLQFFASEAGLTGLEYATGIPGTIGGAISMNAGTALGETGDIVQSVTLVSPDGKFIAKEKDEMGFGYRTSNVPEGHIVVDARFVLRRGDKERVKGQIRELLEKRNQNQPLNFPNAGSVFKNPLEESAGKLIETAKLKGRRVGDAQVSDKHANFIVNAGKATAKDVLALMEIVKQTVLDVHGVRLEPEIKIIGED